MMVQQTPHTHIKLWTIKSVRQTKTPSCFIFAKKNYLEEAIEGNQDTSLLSPLLFWVKRARDKHNKNAKIQDITLQRIFWKMCITQKGEKNLFCLKTDLGTASCSDLRVNWFHRNCFCINASVTCDKRLCRISHPLRAQGATWTSTTNVYRA